MKSPFPGMDPYLEEHWGDVHQRLAIYASNSLQNQLPGGLRARTEERVYVEYDDGGRRTIVPDVAVSEKPNGGPWRSAGDRLAVLEPVAVVASEPQRESFVEIREKGGGRLVTVIEFISPANKLPGTGREQYRRKQRELADADVHLVEIDLVRAGSRVLDFPPPFPADHKSLLMAAIRKGLDHRLFAFPWHKRLPVLPIPLRYEDNEITLDLQALHDQSYHDGAYDDIDYSRNPDLPLSEDLAKWADELLRAQSKR